MRDGDTEISFDEIDRTMIELGEALILASSGLKDLARKRLEVDRWATDLSRRIDLVLSGSDSETLLGSFLYDFSLQVGRCLLLRGAERQIASGIKSLIEKLRGSESDRNTAFDAIKGWLDWQAVKERVDEKASVLLRTLYQELTGEEVPLELSTSAEQRWTYQLIIMGLQDPELNAEARANLNSVIHFLNLQNGISASDLSIDEIITQVKASFRNANLSPEAAWILSYNSSMARLHIAYQTLFKIADHLGIALEQEE